jgi:hypothetical protein
MFRNAAEYSALYPDEAPREACVFAPRGLIVEDPSVCAAPAGATGTFAGR